MMNRDVKQQYANHPKFNKNQDLGLMNQLGYFDESSDDDYEFDSEINQQSLNYNDNKAQKYQNHSNPYMAQQVVQVKQIDPVCREFTMGQPLSTKNQNSLENLNYTQKNESLYHNTTQPVSQETTAVNMLYTNRNQMKFNFEKENNQVNSGGKYHYYNNDVMKDNLQHIEQKQQKGSRTKSGGLKGKREHLKSYQPTVTDSQEIRIVTLENIINDKINYISELETKLQRNKTATNYEILSNINDTPRTNGTDDGTTQYVIVKSGDTTNRFENDVKSMDKIEQLYQQTLNKKNKYRERAKKYKQILRKRDKEIMDLIVEAKDARIGLEKEHKKTQDIKNHLRSEINLIRDDLNSQIRRQQIEYQYEREKFEKDIVDLQQQLDDAQSQSEYYRKEYEKVKNNQVSEHIHQIKQTKQEFESIVERKDEVIDRIQSELKIKEKEVVLLAQRLKDKEHIKSDLSCLNDELIKVREVTNKKDDILKEQESLINDLKNTIQKQEKVSNDRKIKTQDLELQLQNLKDNHQRELNKIQNEHNRQASQTTRDLLKLQTENSRLKGSQDEQINILKKDKINLERDIIDYESQIKTLTMIINDLKQNAREKVTLEQRLEAKHNEISLLKEQIEDLREELYCQKLNISKTKSANGNLSQVNISQDRSFTSNDVQLEQQVVKLSQQNKQLRIEVNELKHRCEDMQFRSQRMIEQKSAKLLENENEIYKDSLMALERKVSDYSQKIRKLEDDNRRLQNEIKLIELNGKLVKGCVNTQENSEMTQRIQELEEYCEELVSQLGKWSALDNKSQLIINKIEEVSHRSSVNPSSQNENTYGGSTIESAALAEKLLNDLLKTTEGFQKLKKINEELKSQTQSDAIYLEPLRKENERIVRENNDLHMQMIKVKEDCEQRENSMKSQLRQIQNEKTDLQFLTNQKDFKIQELDKTLASMRSKLETALTKTYNPTANDVVKGLRKEINQQENVVGRKQDFTLSRPIDSQNVDPNRSNNLIDFQSQQQVWADELRNADQRALMYKKDLENLQGTIQEQDKKIRELSNSIVNREQEIQRLTLLYKGGQTFDSVKFNYDKSTAEETVTKLQKQNEFLNSENFRLVSEIKEIQELLGICETQDPTDKDRAHLKKLVRELKNRNDQMQRDLKAMEKVIEQHKSGQFNMGETAKIMSQEEVDRLKQELEERSYQVQQLEQEIQRIRVESDKVQQYQSAYMSNQKAFAEGMETLSKEVKEKEAKLATLTQENNGLVQETNYLKEELNMYKGKCANLTRDVELSQNYLSKISSDNLNNNEQYNYLKDRVRMLELDLEQAIRAKTDANFDVKRLQTLIDTLEKTMHETKLQSMKAQGDTQNQSTVINRLQTQLNGKQNDIEVLMRQKEELEHMIKTLKSDNLECEKKAADYYQQLLRANENFNILQNEQKLLSQELTMKLSEITRAEKDKLSLERELLQLRPLKSQLENFSLSTQKTIEENVRNEYEKNKLQSKVTELQNDLDLKKNEISDLNQKYNNLIVQNTKLIETLKVFERESFEIQTKIRRGFEVEKENENIAKTIESLRANERDLLRQIEDLKSQVKAKENEIDRMKSRTDNASYYTKTLEQELSEQRTEIQRLNDVISNSQNEVVRTEQRKNQGEVELLDLKRSNQLLRDENGRIEADMVQIRKEYEDEKTKSKGLQQQIDRLRAMVENLDSTREQLVSRLQATSHEKMGEEQDKAVLLQDIQQYKKQLMDKDQVIHELQKSVESLDSNIDDLQQELDSKTQDLAIAKNQVEKYTREFSNIQHQMTVTTGKEDQYARRLLERESEIKQLRIELQGIRQQLEEQSQIVQVKTQEAAELIEDIQTLTRENKYVNGEFSKSAQANEYLRKQNEELIEREKHAQQALRALEMEKSDILTTYRNVCLENERLQESLQMVSMDSKETYSKIQILEKEMYNYQHRLREQEQRERHYIDEIHTLEGHIEKLTFQLESAHQQLRRATDEKEAIINDFNQQRNVSYSLEVGREDLQRTMSHVEAEKQQLRSQLRETSRETDILKRQVELEREKLTQLEQLLVNERKQLQQKEFQVHDLSVQKEHDKAEIQRLLLRGESLQAHIDLLSKHSRSSGNLGNISSSIDQSRISELEEQIRQYQQEVENLRNENSTLQDYNCKYEEQIQVYEAQIQDLEKIIANLS